MDGSLFSRVFRCSTGDRIAAQLPSYESRLDERLLVTCNKNEIDLKAIWSNLVDRSEAYAVLSKTVGTLRERQFHLMTEFPDESWAEIDSKLGTHAEEFLSHFPFKQQLIKVFYEFAYAIRGKRLSEDKSVSGLLTADQARSQLSGLLWNLNEVGLCNEVAQEAFACSTDLLLHDIVDEGFASSSQLNENVHASLISDMRAWALSDYRDNIHWILHGDKQTGWQGFAHKTNWSFTAEEYMTTAMNKLGRAITQRSYDIIDSNAADKMSKLEDLASFAESPVHRQNITNALIKKIRERVIHQGQSTVQILDNYMKLIQDLKTIDPSGVILQRVSRPLKSALQSRTDVVPIILTSLLDGLANVRSIKNVSTEIYSARVAKIMTVQGHELFRQYHEAIDFEDMSWLPEPVDAVSGHQAARNLDALAHLVTLEPADVFIRELQQVLANRLLYQAMRGEESLGTSSGSPNSLEAEKRLLYIFRLRFEELHIQQCEIMLSDVTLSSVLNYDIRKSLYDQEKQLSGDDTDIINPLKMNVQILSKFYWPTLKSSKFELPPPLSRCALQYQEDFQRRKRKRRLEFLESLGRVHMKLELADRVIEIDCDTLEATVIYSFGGDYEGSSKGKSVEEIAESCKMDANLVRSACLFWVSKQVLTRAEADPGRFSVLESLPRSENTGLLNHAVRQSQPASQHIDQPHLKTTMELLRENETMYLQFVIGMLKNQGAMPGRRILTMLKMVVPGGFPFEMEELEKFLAEMAENKRSIERVGGNWRVKK